ncbi:MULTISPECIES: hypothetical protein [Lysinibacillus]|uniref:DUF4083 domain-containing protein n=1 Tax=Lysinibacillus sphaericus TaxID=1421 RepID=A0A544UAC3_LYSSH|nr:hypothetical protein [Lysinibacillus sp. SDF0037]TQR29129.1 hypothetical protein C7Y47_18795 [Lysinibacillus sp. SDF0037]
MNSYYTEDMNSFNSGDILFSAFSIFGLLFSLIPFIFFLWFAISTTKQLKRQSLLLEEINEKLKR